MTKKNPDSGSDLLRLCMDCKHPLTDDNDPVTSITITESPESLGVPVSHGICNICVVARREELARFKAARGKSPKA